MPATIKPVVPAQGQGLSLFSPLSYPILSQQPPRNKLQAMKFSITVALALVPLVLGAPQADSSPTVGSDECVHYTTEDDGSVFGQSCPVLTLKHGSKCTIAEGDESEPFPGCVSHAPNPLLAAVLLTIGRSASTSSVPQASQLMVMIDVSRKSIRRSR